MSILYRTVLDVRLRDVILHKVEDSSASPDMPSSSRVVYDRDVCPLTEIESMRRQVLNAYIDQKHLPLRGSIASRLLNKW